MFIAGEGAYARLRGDAAHSQISGTVTFQKETRGIIVTVQVEGLPMQQSCGGVFAFHIHERAGCNADTQPPFADAGGHYNPKNCPHPYHAGDLPPLFSNDGFAYMQVLTNRFTIEEIIGRSVIIHDGVDDFTTQPAGNAGNRIVCGEIMRM